MAYTQNYLYHYDGSQWRTPWTTKGNDNIGNTDFLGTTNNTDLRFNTNDVQRMVVKADGKVAVGTTNPSGRFEVANSDLYNYGGASCFMTFDSNFPTSNINDNDTSTYLKTNNFPFGGSGINFRVSIDFGSNPRIVNKYQLITHLASQGYTKGPTE